MADRVALFDVWVDRSLDGHPIVVYVETRIPNEPGRELYVATPAANEGSGEVKFRTLAELLGELSQKMFVVLATDERHNALCAFAAAG